MGAFLEVVAEHAKPDVKLSILEWSEQYRIIPEGNKEPGPYRADRTPWARIIMAALDPGSPYERVFVMKGSQIGFTEIGNNWIGHCIDQNPAPILYVMPTEGSLRKNSKRRIDPLIEDTPALKAKVSVKKSRDSNNTTFYKQFPGGEMLLTSAGSTTNLKSDAIKNVFCDEIDDYKQDRNQEGDIISLTWVRTRTYEGVRKGFFISSPKTKGESLIEKYIEQTDKRYFYVPCPECQHMQTIKWRNIKWEWGKPETVYLECENVNCDYQIKNDDKEYMLQHIQDRPSRKSNSPKDIGFVINALYSPVGWLSWQSCAEQWQEVYNGVRDGTPDLFLLKVFINTVLGETFEYQGDAPPYQALFNRREKYEINTLPPGVMMVTAGIDVQKDRAEMEIVGWGKNLENWSIDYRVLDGDPKKAELWQTLRNILNHETFTHPGGRDLQIELAAIDTGSFGWTNNVYHFARSMPDKVIAIKGSKINFPIGTPSTVDVTIDGVKDKEGCLLYEIGVDFFKSMLYADLKLNLNEDGTHPPGFCHFPTDYPIDFFKGLTSEQIKKVKTRSGHVYTFVNPTGKRNEPLDCRVYAMAAASHLGLLRMTPEEWQEYADYFTGKKKPESDQGQTLSKGI